MSDRNKIERALSVLEAYEEDSAHVKHAINILSEELALERKRERLLQRYSHLRTTQVNTCRWCEGLGEHPRAEALLAGQEHSGVWLVCEQCSGTGVAK